MYRKIVFSEFTFLVLNFFTASPFSKGEVAERNNSPLFCKEGPGEILYKSGAIYFFSSAATARDAECTGTVASRNK